MLPKALYLACRTHGVRLTRFVLVTKVSAQKVYLFERVPSAGASTGTQPSVSVWLALGARPIRSCAPASRPGSSYVLRRQFRASTSRFGMGEESGSNRTPRGLHRVGEKVGAGYPQGTVFESRKPAGLTWQGRPDAAIAHRILWLEGLEPGFNQGGQVDSHARYIYIHGLANEPSLGRPASRGCIHLAAADLMPLFDLIARGTLVWIEW